MLCDCDGYGLDELTDGLCLVVDGCDCRFCRRKGRACASEDRLLAPRFGFTANFGAARHMHEHEADRGTGEYREAEKFRRRRQLLTHF